MANSYQLYTADGGTDNFNITIDYLSTAHLTVYVSGVLQTLTTHYTINTTDNRIEFVADYTPAADAQVKIKRTTPRGKSDRVVDFQDASVLTEADLDNSALQNLYIAQEADDTSVDSISLDETLTYYDAGSKRIQNVLAPLTDSDIATKNYVDAQTLFGGVVSPQVWSITVPSSPTVGKFELADPAPSSTRNELFICQVGAVQQAPSSEDGVTAIRDFKIYLDADTKYYIEFEDGAFPSQGGDGEIPPGDSKIVVQNFGVSRNVLDVGFKFTAADTDVPSLQVTAIADQTSNLTEWQDSSEDAITSVGVDGSLNLLSSDGATYPVSFKKVENSNQFAMKAATEQVSENKNLAEFRETGGDLTFAVDEEAVAMGTKMRIGGAEGGTATDAGASQLIITGSSGQAVSVPILQVHEHGGNPLFRVNPPSDSNDHIVTIRDKDGNKIFYIHEDEGRFYEDLVVQGDLRVTGDLTVTGKTTPGLIAAGELTCQPDSERQLVNAFNCSATRAFGHSNKTKITFDTELTNTRYWVQARFFELNPVTNTTYFWYVQTRETNYVQLYHTHQGDWHDDFPLGFQVFAY